MFAINAHFAAGDRRADFLAHVVSLVSSGATHEELVDAAVWASDLFVQNFVEQVLPLDSDGAAEVLLIAAHDGFMCECCGHHTLMRPPTRRSLQRCTACGWQDIPPDFLAQSDLDSAQQSVTDYGVCDEALRETASPPRPGQVRDNRFETFEARRLRLLSEVERVFASTQTTPGMTLEDANAEDIYRSPREEFEYERRQRWTEVQDERLAQCDEWIYLDQATMFFYLPALLRYVLRHRRSLGHCSDPIDRLFDWHKPDGGRWLLSLATADQRRFIADFLELVYDEWINHSPRWLVGSEPKERKRAAAGREMLWPPSRR